MNSEVGSPASCPFCDLPPERVIYRSELALVIRDAYPVSQGHTLVLPTRHVASLWETTTDEQSALLEALSWARADIVLLHQPDGFNVAINDGAAAGQTVMHVHVHLIPRYVGDHGDPRGGARWIFPEKAPYWTKK